MELLLAVGASRWEATRGVIQRSVTAAISPALNQMSVIGLVSLPELMSGQILAGASPFKVDSFLRLTFSGP